MTMPAPRATVSDMLTNSLEAAVAARSAPPAPAIEVRGVRKSYAGVTALDGVDLTVRRGEVLALLGPNGAGKTTLVEILEGHRSADAGAVDVLGFDPARRERAFRERVGIVLQDAALEQELTVREAIELFAASYPDPLPADEVAELVGLGDRLRRPHAHPVGRPAAAARRRRRHRRRPGADLPRRADHRLRSRRPPPVVGADRRPARPRPDDPAHHPLHGGGAAARRPRGGAGRRPLIAVAAPDELGGDDAALVSFRLPGRASSPPTCRVEVDGPGRRSRFRTATPTRDLAPLLSWAAVRGYELEGLTVSRPSLEDVYLKLTEEAA